MGSGGSSCSSCDAPDGLLESTQEIKEQVIRDVHDEVNGFEGLLDKSPLMRDEAAVVLRASAPRIPVGGVPTTPRLLGSLSSLLQPDGSRKGTRKNSHGLVVHLSAIPEQQQATCLSAHVVMTPRTDLLSPTPHTDRRRASPRGSSASPTSRGSTTPVCGTPQSQKWPSLGTIESVAGEQVSHFPISSYPVSNEPVKLLSRHIAFAPSPTHSVHQSEHGVTPYGEIYGEHPMSFEFDGQGNMIPRDLDDIEMLLGGSRHYIETVRGLKKRR